MKKTAVRKAALILALCIRESAVVDIVGKILTPLLLQVALSALAMGKYMLIGLA